VTDELGTRIERRLRARRLRRRHGRRVAALCVLAGMGLAAAGTAAVAFLVDVPQLIVDCDVSSAHARAVGATTFVRARDGTRLGAIGSPYHREPVPLERMSPWLPQATVAIEDRRFWSRRGAIDYEAILRAAKADLEARRAVQGGSTLTQQLVRDRYLTGEGTTLKRKLTEACLAGQVEQREPKRQIAQEYLNRVFYGHRAYGVEAAARTFFDRSAARLTLPQAALLAGLPQAPTRFDPYVHPAAAVTRRNAVLTALRDEEAISAARYRAAARHPLRLRGTGRYTTVRSATFFDQARRELERRYGRRRARRGGLRVRTTLDPRLQRLAVQAVQGWLRLPSDPAAAVVAIDPSSGAVRAMTAIAPGHQKLQFNLASQSHRQAGSSFKTFTLAAAMEAGIPLGSTWNGPSSLTIPDRRCENATGAWVVHNYADEGHGTMSLAQATAHSVNTIFAQVALKVGPGHVVDVARRMGIRSPLKAVCSITLGPEGVAPLEMADAFATLAARGLHHPPRVLQRVQAADGRVLERLSRKGDRALRPDVADHVTTALSGVILAGTGRAAALGRPAAGKTGTAESFKDAWFCGYVPQLATCVWVGRAQAELPLHGIAGFADVVGGSVPARIWHDFMAGALRGVPVRPLPGALDVRRHQRNITGPDARGGTPYVLRAPSTTPP
jgi:penicillin-binding protein 1A